MKVRIRFVFTLTVIISLILATSFIIIFELYSNNRENDFDNRLWAHAYNAYQVKYNVIDTNKNLLAKLSYYLPGAPADFQVIIIDSASRVVSKEPDDLVYTPDKDLLETVKQQKEYYFSSEQVQGVGLYFNQPGHACFVIATGLDKFGLARLDSLKLIMTLVSLGSIIILGLFTFYYVIIVTRPLINLSIQMRKVSENNLKHRVEVGKGDTRRNEILRIASNFNAMLDRLERAFNMQRNFVHHASHDLRTPLATMLSQTESALRKELTPQQSRRVLESLKEDQQGMIELTNALLLLSQYENINNTAGWLEIRIDEVLYEAIASMQKMFPDVLINLNFLAGNENESDLCIRGNEVLLRSAFLNLLKNAMKYSENNKVAVTLKAETDKVVISFENKGPVMQPEEVERMFFPFFRGENAQLKKGFGLGLSIVKRIVELHRCLITYTIVDKNINCFTLTFFHN